MMTEVTISPELAYTAECVLRQFGWVAEADAVEIAADLTRAITKPVAEAAKEIVDDVKDATGTNNKEDRK
jgi:hypothetical protein